MEYEYDGTYLTIRGHGTHRQIRMSPDEMLDVCAAFVKWNREHNERSAYLNLPDDAKS